MSQGYTHIFETQSIRSEGGGIGLNADGWLLAAADGDQSDAGKLRDLLRQRGIREVFNFGEWQAIGGKRQSKNRSISRIDFAVNRWIGKITRQESGGGVDGGLHFLLGNVNIQLKIELQGNDRATVGAGGGHLAESRYLTELPLHGRCHGRGHHVRPGARIKSGYLNGRIIHLGKGRDRQLLVSHNPHQQQPDHEQRGGHRTKNE